MKAAAEQITEAIIIRHALNDGDILHTAADLGVILAGFGIETRDIRRGLPSSRWTAGIVMVKE
jgi:hypothetical protein